MAQRGRSGGAQAGDGQYRERASESLRSKVQEPRASFLRVLRGGRRGVAEAPLCSNEVPEARENDGPERVWATVRSELERSLPAATFDLWIDPLKAAGAQAETLYLTGPDRVRTWVERRYLGSLEEALRRTGSSFDRIQLVDPPSRPSPGAGTSRVAEPVPVNSSHEFDRFVIGPGNRFAHAAALAVAEAPGEAYNPLYLHGPPGLGKTHLMGAIASYMRGHHPEMTVHYTTAERFTSEFVTALRTHGPERFKQRYRGLDALLIDDVQFLEGKERTEEEFVHTFNALFAAGKQIVMSSDRPPGSLVRLEERLRDRFEWGLTVELDAPDLRTRVALLWRFASDAVDGLPEPGVLREIADRAPGNVRRLEGALTRVLAVSSVYGEPLAGGAIDRALGSKTQEAAARAGLRRRSHGQRDPGRGLFRARHLPRRSSLRQAHADRRAGAAPRHVPGARAHPALPLPDRQRVRPRSLDRHPRHPFRGQQERARLCHRRGYPQRPCSVGGNSSRS